METQISCKPLSRNKFVRRSKSKYQSHWYSRIGEEWSLGKSVHRFTWARQKGSIWRFGTCNFRDIILTRNNYTELMLQRGGVWTGVIHWQEPFKYVTTNPNLSRRLPPWYWSQLGGYPISGRCCLVSQQFVWALVRLCGCARISTGPLQYVVCRSTGDI